MNELIEDIASLENWFIENEDCFIAPYIEQNFKEVSWSYEYNFMMGHLFFTKVIIDNWDMSNEHKLKELFDELSYGKSKIVTIVGGRDQGKTAIALLISEELYNRNMHQVIYYVGNPANKEAYPSWIKFVNTLDELPNNVVAMIDEAALKYSARRFMSGENLDLTQKMVILRHNGCSLLFMTQHLKLYDINIGRLSDIVIYKPGANYGNEKEKESDDLKQIRIRMKPRDKKDAMIEYRIKNKYRTLTHGLPSFWDDEKISKAYKCYKKPEKPIMSLPKTSKRRNVDVY
jgi:hypothetical protein